MSPRKGGPSAGTNTALPTGVQEGSRPALPLLGEVDPEDGRGAGHSQRVLEERWLRQHEVDEGVREGLTTDERQELSRLRRENKTLRQERGFLKKAAVFFAREDGTR
jgi:hypothetical protein